MVAPPLERNVRGGLLRDAETFALSEEMDGIYHENLLIQGGF